MRSDLKTYEIAENILNNKTSKSNKHSEKIVTHIKERRPISTHPQSIEKDLNYWDKVADKVATVGGSWGFIFIFLSVLLLWMGLNTKVLTYWHLAFDPYPFIFLNLMLSMIAALQAPVIMMSQNRSAKRDRLMAEHDYEVNLRAEVEIMALHEKWDRLQLDTLNEKLERQDAMILKLQTTVEKFIKAS
jgi:uncharacterized membrane protein